MNDPYSFRGMVIPPHMLLALQRYAASGLPVGDFLRAVICNDLKEACGRADDTNQPILPAYVAWLYNEAPMACWGSEQRHLQWLKDKAHERMAYVLMLEGHDWAFEHSDDQRVWSAGTEKLKTLRAMQKSIDPERLMWNVHAPEGHKLAITNEAGHEN